MAKAFSSSTPAGVKATMKAMVLDAPGRPLRLQTLLVPEPGPGQVRLRVSACGVCRTRNNFV